MAVTQYSVLIPAYNEESRLPAALHQVERYFSSLGAGYEVLVIDDGSTDATAAAAENCSSEVRLLRHEVNAGKGAAILTGFEAAEGEVILFTDTDLSVPIEHAKDLLAAIEEGADVAIGSRRVPGARIVVHQPWVREWMGRVFNLAVQLLLLPGMADTQCGFKALRREAARRIGGLMHSSGFCFDVEMLVIARELGLVVRELPVAWYNSSTTRVRVFRDSLEMAWTLLQIARRRRAGGYR